MIENDNVMITYQGDRVEVETNDLGEAQGPLIDSLVAALISPLVVESSTEVDFESKAAWEHSHC